MALELGTAAFAFTAGAASFFSPCSVGLFPAYVGFFLGGQAAAAEPAGLGRGAALGAVAASGFFLLFLLLGGLVALAGSALLAGGTLKWASVGIGVAIAALGALTLVGRPPRLSVHLPALHHEGALGVFAFGTAYGLASLGCTLPVFLAATLGALAVGGAGALALAVVAYGAGMALLMVLVSAALAASMGSVRQWLRAAVPVIQKGSSAAMVVGGAVLVYYYVMVWA